MIVMSMGGRMHLMEEMVVLIEEFTPLVRSEGSSELWIEVVSFLLKISIRVRRFNRSCKSVFERSSNRGMFNVLV